MEIEIRIENGKPVVAWRSHGENERTCHCDNIEQAVVYARAFQDGFTAAQGMIRITKTWQFTAEMSEFVRSEKKAD